LSGEGPHAVNVQLESDPSRTATLPLAGSRAAERSLTLLSTLGAEVTGSLLPGEGSVPVRGLHLRKGAAGDAPFHLERVDASRARLTASVAAGPVCVVAVDLLGRGERREVRQGSVTPGQVLEVEVPGPAGLVAVGAYVGGVPWEGWAVMLHPDRLT